MPPDNDNLDSITDATVGEVSQSADPGLSGSLNQSAAPGLSDDAWDGLLAGAGADPAQKDKPIDKPIDKPGDKPGDKPDEFDGVSLPPGKSGQVRESFDKLKAIGRAKVKLSDEARIAAVARVAELEKQVNAGLPPEVQKELDDHRQWRAKLDIDADPEFKKFDKQVATNDSLIFDTLKTAGMSDEQIKKVKDIGTAALNWAPILAKMSEEDKSLVTLKIAENRGILHVKKQAQDEARVNIQDYLAKRDPNSRAALTVEANELVAHSKEYLSDQEWFYKKEIPATATAEEKRVLERHNQVAGEAFDMLKEALGDRSLKMKAQLAIGTIKALQLHYKLEDAAAQIAGLEKKLVEKEDHISKVRKASATGSRSTVDNKSGHASGDTPNEFGFTKDGRIKDTNSALDDLLREATGGGD